MVLTGVLFFLIYSFAFLFVSCLQVTGLVYAVASLFHTHPKLNEVKAHPKVGVVVACRNEGDVVLRTVDFLLTLTYQNKEIIIGDDSDNGTYELLLKKYNLIPELYRKTDGDGKIFIAKNKKLTIIHREKNIGFKAGNLNICHEYLEQNNIPFYALFDADWLPQIDFIEKIIPYFYTYSNASCVQFKRLLPSRTSSFFSRITSLSPEAAYQVDLPGRANLKTFVLFCGSSGVFRTSAVTDAGGWKSGDLTEDIDLSLRLYLKGYKVYFDRKTESYGEETPSHFSDFMKQQARWQRGTTDCVKKYLFSALASKKLSLNEKIGITYQSFIFFPYFLVLLFILFNITLDVLSLLGVMPASLYILFGKTGEYFWWLAFFIFFFDLIKLGISALQSKNKKAIFFVPLTTLAYWALIPSGFWANIKSLFNIKEGWFLTPKSKAHKLKRKYTYRLSYLALFIAVYFTYAYELILGYTLNWYHFLLPLSLLWGVVSK